MHSLGRGSYLLGLVRGGAQARLSAPPAPALDFTAEGAEALREWRIRLGSPPGGVPWEKELMTLSVPSYCVMSHPNT